MRPIAGGRQCTRGSRKSEFIDRVRVDYQGWSTFCGLAIIIYVIGFNVLGDGLREVLDPTRRCNSRRVAGIRGAEDASTVSKSSAFRRLSVDR